MLSLPRLLKVAYLLILGGAILALCKPAPVHAQRAIAYPALPAQINITVTSNPFTAILSAQQMLFLAGAATMLPSGATILGSGTMNGGGFGGGMGMGGIQGGFGGGMGGFNGKKAL